MAKEKYVSNKELTEKLVEQGFDFSPDPFADEEPAEVITLSRDDVMEYLGLKPEKEPGKE